MFGAKSNGVNSQVVSTMVTKDTTIGQVVKDFPSVVDILTDNGVHCVGCHASYWETIEEGLKGHGLSDAEVKRVVDKMNSVVVNRGVVAPDASSLRLSDAALKKIKSLTSSDTNKGKGFRVNVDKGGCSGFMYNFKLEKSAVKGEKTIEQEGVKVFVNEETLSMLKGSIIDYVDTLQGAGFKVKNPNATHPCGCGESFR